MVFPVAAQIRSIIECQGCGEHIEMKPALALLAGIQQAQGAEFKNFTLEFETKGSGA